MEKYCIARQATDDNIIRHMRIVYWITKPTHSECVILIVFPLQQWLNEGTSILLYASIASLVTAKPLIPKAAGSSGRAVIRLRFAAVRLLRLWVRIPPRTWMNVSCECCVL